MLLLTVNDKKQQKFAFAKYTQSTTTQQKRRYKDIVDFVQGLKRPGYCSATARLICAIRQPNQGAPHNILVYEYFIRGICVCINLINIHL